MTDRSKFLTTADPEKGMILTRIDHGNHNFEAWITDTGDHELQAQCVGCGTFAAVKIWPGHQNWALPQISEYITRTTSPVCAEQKALNEARFVHGI